jgi:radical SAM superfamily enzyme YgiQ (UPF0313 family)
LSVASIRDEVDVKAAPQSLIIEKGRYVFPHPDMAVVPASGLESLEVRISSHPPPEHGSLILQATSGCPWNRCLFCGGRKIVKFMQRSEEVKEDVLIAKKYYGDAPQRIFLGGGNSIVLRTAKLVDILNLCFNVFPNLQRVSTYGSARFIIRKGLDQLKALREAGLKKIYVGLETGDDALLKYMDKGASSDEMVLCAKMAKEADIELSITVLMGLGGTGSWKRNAEQTGAILNQMQPSETRLHHLILHRASPLYALVQTGQFEEASRHEILKEMRELVSLLTYNTKLHTHRLTMRGPMIKRLFPDEKEKILTVLDFALHHFFGEKVDLNRIKNYSMTDVYKWDGYQSKSVIDYDDIF